MKSQQNKCKKLWRLLEDWDDPKRLFRPRGTLDYLFCTSAVCGQGRENDLKLGEETMWTVLIMFCCCDTPAVQSSTAERQIIKTSWIKKSLRLQEHIFTVMTVCVCVCEHTHTLTHTGLKCNCPDSCCHSWFVIDLAFFRSRTEKSGSFFQRFLVRLKGENNFMDGQTAYFTSHIKLLAALIFHIFQNNITVLVMCTSGLL